MMLSILKFVSILSSALFGIYASFVNFKDKEGKVTTNGYIGLIGVIISAILTGILQVYSDVESSKQSLIVLEKNNLILNNIKRSITPLDGLLFDLSLEPNWNNSEMKKLFNNVDDNVEFLNTQSSTSFGNLGKDIFIGEPLISEVLYTMEVDLFFYKEPIDNETFNAKKLSSTADADLVINISSRNIEKSNSAFLGGQKKVN
jgi:hypothetical protein